MDSIDARLETVLARREPTLGDDGFSDAVMNTLPRRRLFPAKARHWSLGIAAAIGGGLAVLLGAPLENALPTLASGGAASIAIAVALVAAVLGVPTAWAFYSR